MPLERSRLAQAGLLLLVAFATRAWLFGNPVIHTDEQFYLLVGDRMLDGAWPFVDIFDRKPVGLFLIFAALRALGGDGVLVYQYAATLVAAATAFLVVRIARRFATPAHALAAGVLYLVWLVVLDGAGGQSSVWQNLLVAAAAALVAFGAADGRGGLTRRGVAAMLLVGAAMQVKYVALFDGVFLGLMLMYAGYATGRAPARIAADAGLWIAAALLPTALAWGVYAAAGHNDVFVYANFISIFGQRSPHTLAKNLVKMAASLGLVVPLLWLAWRGRRTAWPLAAWSAVSLAGIVVMASFDQHYFLPLAVPLCAAAAAGLDRGGRGFFLTTLAFGVVAAGTLTVWRVHQRGDARAVGRVAALIGQRPERCLFAYGSEAIFYYLSHSCLPTRLVFRGHLGHSKETGGVPLDQVAETARVLATRPSVMVVREHRRTTNFATARLVDAAVAAHYAKVATVRVGTLNHTVYRLRDDARAR